MVSITSPIQQILLVTERHLSIRPRPPQLALYSSEFKDPIRWRDQPTAVHRRSFAISVASITGSGRCPGVFDVLHEGVGQGHIASFGGMSIDSI